MPMSLLYLAAQNQTQHSCHVTTVEQKGQVPPLAAGDAPPNTALGDVCLLWQPPPSAGPQHKGEQTLRQPSQRPRK